MAQPKWDVATPVDGAKGTTWHNIGVAWEGKRPGVISIVLNVHPIGSRICLFERGERNKSSTPPGAGASDWKEPDDPDFPF